MNYILVCLSVVLALSCASFCFAWYKFKLANKKLTDDLNELQEALVGGHRAVQLALKYEEFYNSTVGDIGEIVDSLNALVGKRQMLSDDPDVQNLIRILAIAHDTLLGYMNAKSPREQQESGEAEGN